MYRFHWFFGTCVLFGGFYEAWIYKASIWLQVFGWLYCKCSNCGLHFKEDLFMTACVTYFYKLQHDDKNNFNKSSKEWMLMNMFTLASIFVVK